MVVGDQAKVRENRARDQILSTFPFNLPRWSLLSLTRSMTTLKSSFDMSSKT